MRRRGLEPMHDDHINVTPLIDVVMCLIIFFLCCSTLAKQEANERIRIPRTELKLESPDQRGRLTINLVPPAREAGSSDAPINGNEEPWIYVGAQRVAMGDLPAYLRREKAENPDIKVILRADEALNYQWISPVLLACTTANITSVNFSTRDQTQP